MAAPSADAGRGPACRTLVQAGRSGDARNARSPWFVLQQVRARPSVRRRAVTRLRDSAMTENYEAPVLPEHAAALEAYLDGQVAVAELRKQAMPGAPWPTAENPMLAYLLHAATESFENGPRAGDLHTALIWLAAHSWFEGALDRSADVAAAAATTALTTCLLYTSPSPRDGLLSRMP